MTTVSSRVFLANPIHYFNLANSESVAIKRGKMTYRIMPEPAKFENISPSGDPFWADPRNVAELERRIKRRREGIEIPVRLTPELKKELLGI